MPDSTNWLEGLLAGIKAIWNRGTALPQEPVINFLSPLTATDNPTLGTTDISISGGGGGGGLIAADVATTGNVSLSGTLVVDGFTPVNGVSRIFAGQQSNASQNGVYLYNSAGAWTRTTDFNTASQFAAGVAIGIEKGTTLGGSVWILSAGITTLGSDAILFNCQQGTRIPAFAPTLSLASGGAGPLEIGQGWSPTFNGSPAANGPGVTAFTLHDTDGNTSNPTGAGPYAAPVTGGTYTKTTVTSENVYAAVTQNGNSANTNNVGLSWLWRAYGAFLDTASGATGATSGAAGSNSATLTGGGATATSGGSALYGSSLAGSTFSYTISSGSFWVYDLRPHTASSYTYHDNTTGFLFSMSVVATFTFTTQYGVSVSYDLVRSDFIQTQSRTLLRVN